MSDSWLVTCEECRQTFSVPSHSTWGRKIPVHPTEPFLSDVCIGSGNLLSPELLSRKSQLAAAVPDMLKLALKLSPVTEIDGRMHYCSACGGVAEPGATFIHLPDCSLAAVESFIEEFEGVCK